MKIAKLLQMEFQLASLPSIVWDAEKNVYLMIYVLDIIKSRERNCLNLLHPPQIRIIPQ